jgi:hypothetical protein
LISEKLRIGVSLPVHADHEECTTPVIFFDHFTKIVEELLLLRHVTPLSRRNGVYFCSGVHKLKQNSQGSEMALYIIQVYT